MISYDWLPAIVEGCILLFSAWLSYLCYKIKKSIGYEYDKKLIKIKQISPKQFELYNNIWKTLYDLKISLRDFMYYLRDEELKIFEEKLAKASNIVQENAIIIDEEHYTKLAEIINCFGTCETGNTYIMVDQKKMQGSQEVIKLLIKNQQLQEKLHEELDAFMKVLRNKILG